MGDVSRGCLVALLACVITATPASAGVPHVVQPGETLWSIAAANNFTTRALAAANGLSETSSVVAGQTITIPSVAEAAAAMQCAGITPGVPAASSGSYSVRPGDTLTGIAATLGVSASSLAAANGLDPSGYVFA